MLPRLASKPLPTGRQLRTTPTVDVDGGDVKSTDNYQNAIIDQSSGNSVERYQSANHGGTSYMADSTTKYNTGNALADASVFAYGYVSDNGRVNVKRTRSGEWQGGGHGEVGGLGSMNDWWGRWSTWLC